MIQRTCKKCSPNKTWEATNRVVILFFMLINITFLHAQNVFHGEIVSKNGKVGIANGYILLIQNGTIFKTTTSYKDGSFTIKDVPAGDYIVEVTCLGYQTICDSLSIKDTTKVSVSAMLVYTRQKNIAQVFILERYFFVSIYPAAIPGTYLAVFLVAVLQLC